MVQTLNYRGGPDDPTPRQQANLVGKLLVGIAFVQSIPVLASAFYALTNDRRQKMEIVTVCVLSWCLVSTVVIAISGMFIRRRVSFPAKVAATVPTLILILVLIGLCVLALTESGANSYSCILVILAGTFVFIAITTLVRLWMLAVEIK